MNACGSQALSIKETLLCMSLQGSWVVILISWITSKKIWKLNLGYCFSLFFQTTMLASSAFRDRLMNITVNNFFASFLAYVEDDKCFCQKATCRACLAGEMAEPPAAALPSARSGRDALARAGSEVGSSWQLHPCSQLLARSPLLGFRAAQAGCDWGQLFCWTSPSSGLPSFTVF